MFDDYRSITAAASPEPVFSTGGYPVDDATAAMPYTHNLSYVACPDMVKSQDNSATPMPTYSMSSAPDQEEDLDAILREPLDWEVMEDDGLFFL